MSDAQDVHGQAFIDAVRKSDIPEEAKPIAYAMAHLLANLARNLERIADALEKPG